MHAACPPASAAATPLITPHTAAAPPGDWQDQPERGAKGRGAARGMATGVRQHLMKSRSGWCGCWCAACSGSLLVVCHGSMVMQQADARRTNAGLFCVIYNPRGRHTDAPRAAQRRPKRTALARRTAPPHMHATTIRAICTAAFTGLKTHTCTPPLRDAVCMCTRHGWQATPLLLLLHLLAAMVGSAGVCSKWGAASG